MFDMLIFVVAGMVRLAKRDSGGTESACQAAAFTFPDGGDFKLELFHKKAPL